jgi:hypothetical protein
MNNQQGQWTLTIATLVMVATVVVSCIWWERKSPIERDTVTGPLVFQTPGGLLEVSAVNTTESFEKRSILTVAGVPLGTTVSQIQVPVTYRYKVELAKNWQTHTRGGRLLVIAPAVTPSLPVGIDTSKVRMQTSSGWARFDKQANLDALLREVSPDLAALSMSSRYIELQREQARKTVTEFAVKWLITQERWKSITPSQVKVYFADEPIGRLSTFGPEFAGPL